MFNAVQASDETCFLQEDRSGKLAACQPSQAGSLTSDWCHSDGSEESLISSILICVRCQPDTEILRIRSG